VRGPTNDIPSVLMNFMSAPSVVLPQCADDTDRGVGGQEGDGTVASQGVLLEHVAAHPKGVADDVIRAAMGANPPAGSMYSTLSPSPTLRP
jgi:hypothetical protein